VPLLRSDRGTNQHGSLREEEQQQQQQQQQPQRVKRNSNPANGSSDTSRNQSTASTSTPTTTIAIGIDIDREEFNNVKKLCARLYKAHGKMARQMRDAREHMNAQSQLLATMGTAKEDILEELFEQQRSQFFRNSIALDMKERAYRGRLDQMEQRYVVQLETRLDRCRTGTRLWNETTRERLLDLQSIVEAEARTNAVFRNDVNANLHATATAADRVERYRDETERRENDGERCVFATHSGEEDETVSRCGCCCCGGGGGGSALRSGDKTFLRSDPNGTMARYALVDSDNDNANGNKMDTTTTDSIIGENNARDHRCTTASLWKRPWTNSVGE